jgi:hypothetical protein
MDSVCIDVKSASTVAKTLKWSFVRKTGVPTYQTTLQFRTWPRRSVVTVEDSQSFGACDGEADRASAEALQSISWDLLGVSRSGTAPKEKRLIPSYRILLLPANSKPILRV